jgi:hypothetical protein
MPAFFDFTVSLPYNFQDLGYFVSWDAVILRQFDARFEPDFDFAVGGLDMHVHAVFLARVEIVPVLALTEDGWTHREIISRLIDPTDSVT